MSFIEKTHGFPRPPPPRAGVDCDTEDAALSPHPPSLVVAGVAAVGAPQPSEVAAAGVSVAVTDPQPLFPPPLPQSYRQFLIKKFALRN